MASILVLPDELLAMVLRRCTGSKSDSLKKLKGPLSLLGVCRRWRHVTQPLVFATVVVQCGEMRVPKAGRGGQLRRSGPLDIRSLCSDSTAIKTNLDIIISAGCSSIVKEVHLTIRYRSSLVPALHEIVRRMEAAPDGWGRVGDLNVNTRLDRLGIGWQAQRNAETQQHVRAACAALAAQLPGIRTLILMDADKSAIPSALYGQLAGVYSDQVDIVRSNRPVVLPQGRRFAQVTELVLAGCKGLDTQLPQTDVSQLEGLFVFGWPSNHSWVPLCPSGDTSTEIVFPKLRRAQALYGSLYRADGAVQRHRDGHPWTLKFPCLADIIISCEGDVCPLLDYAVFPARMDQFVISGSLAVLQAAAQIKLPAMRRLCIHVGTDVEDVRPLFAAIKSIMDSAPRTTHRALELSSAKLFTVPANVVGIDLNCLCLSAATSFGTMLGLLKALPNLVRLTLAHTTLDGFFDDILTPGLRDHALVAALCKRMKWLEVGFKVSPHPIEEALPAAKYLLLKIPSLRRFRSNSDLLQPLHEFAREYAQWYPHLAAIQICLCRPPSK